MSQCVAFQGACLGQGSPAPWALALHLSNEETEEIIPVFSLSSQRPSASKRERPLYMYK